MKYSNLFRLAAAATVIACSLWLGAGVASVMAATPSKATLSVQLQTVTQRDGTEYQVLAAKLNRAEDDYPLSERTITFFEVVDFFGPSNIPLGSAVTASFGVATLKYETNEVGNHHILAVFSGDQDTLPAQAAADIEITGTSTAPAESPTAVMDKITHWTLIAAGTALVAICILLLSVIFRVIRGISGTRAS